MDQVLYSKYNSHRKPEFRLVTEVRESNGEKYVSKHANEPSAEGHLRNMIRNRRTLENSYTDIRVLPVREEKDSLVFPFVEGESLKDKVVKSYTDRESFVRKSEELFGIMFSVKDECKCEFAPSEAFREVFGDTELKGVPAVCPANADAMFGNFIEQDGKLFCIDYEWVFDFSVPVGFLRYRALCYLHYELRQSLFADVSIEEFMGWFGIDEAIRKQYEAMEYSFQQYVHGENIRYQYLHRYLKSARKPMEEIETLHAAIGEREQRLADYNLIVEDRERYIHKLDEDISQKKDTIEEHERHIRKLDVDIRQRDNTIEEKKQEIEGLNKAVYDKDVHIHNLEAMIRMKDGQYAELNRQYQEITNAFFWKITKPMRIMLTKLKVLVKKNDHVYMFFRVLKMSVTRGPKQALEMRRQELARKNRANALICIPTDEEMERQKKTEFPRKIKFSILVPLYNTPEKFLKDMIESVLCQTYGNWELCLADGSDDDHAYVGETCKKYAKKDQRIRYQKLKENLGISENTNACLELATGEYIGLFDHDDLLHPFALFEYMQAICDRNADFLYSDETTFHDTPADAYNQHFKSDFAPDTLRSYNYICHFTVFSRKLLEKAGGLFRKEYDGSQDYDMILRLTEQAESIVHIPKVLYYWRAHKNSTSADVGNKPYIIDAAKAALSAHLERIGLRGTVEDSRIASSYRIQYEIEGNPLISIIIPNKDHIEDLSKCLDSIREKSTWQNWEVIVVENNSTDPATFEYYKDIEKDERIRVVKWEREFNYSAINNFGAQFAHGDIFLLLNNDIEVITSDWLEQMAMFAQRKDVGAVGAMLYYPDDTIQHAGVIVGLGGVAGHSHKNFQRGTPGYAIRLTIAQNLSAVTGACLMVRRKVWEEVGGLDEKFAVAFNDVDLCMKIRAAGYLIVWTPYAELYHYESKSRGYEDTPEKERRFEGEKGRFGSKWGQILVEGDPYYNPNLTLDREDFSPR